MNPIIHIGIICIGFYLVYMVLTRVVSGAAWVAGVALKVGIGIIVLCAASWIYNHTVVYFI